MASIEFQGLEELDALLRRMAAGLGRRTDEAVRGLASFFIDEARSRAPVRTGRLRRSIGLRREDSSRYVVEASAPYAGYVEYGSGPHIIEPRRAFLLRFSVDGEIRYAKRVRHPGSSPQPYWRPAFGETAREARRRLAEVIQEI